MARDSDSRTRPSLLEQLATTPPNEEAWSKFVDRYGGKIYHWCRGWKLSEIDAQDVTQNVLVRLLEKMRSFRYDPSGSFRSWLKTLTHHAWRDFVSNRDRAGQGRASSETDELLNRLEASEDLIEHLGDEFDREIFEKAAGRVRLRVAPQTWEAFRLTALEGLSGAEVSARLGMRPSQVFVSKHRVQKLLQEAVEKLEGYALRENR